MLGDFKGRDAIKVGFSPLKPSYFFGLLFKFVADNDGGADDDSGVDDRGERAHCRSVVFSNKFLKHGTYIKPKTRNE